jgi:hypothetical protein
MNAQRVNEIQALLEGVPLPASRAMLVAYASAEDSEAARLLEQRLPDEEFDRIDKVGQLLLAEAGPPYAPTPLPVAESGKPPGGDDYLRAFPQSGSVRRSSPKDHPQSKVLEEQTKTQKKQKTKQDS